MDPQLQAPRTGTPARTALAPPQGCRPRPRQLPSPSWAHAPRRTRAPAGSAPDAPQSGRGRPRPRGPAPREAAHWPRAPPTGGRAARAAAASRRAGEARAAGTGRDVEALPLPSRAAPRLSAGRAEAAAVSAGWASATLGAAGPFLRPDAQPAPWRVVRPRFRPQAGPPCPSQTLVARPPRPHRPSLPPGGSGGSASAPDQPPAGAKAAFGKLAFRLTRLRFKAFGGFPRPPCSGPPRPIGPACAACLLHPGTLRGPGRCAGCSGARRGNREVPAARRDGRAPGGAAT